MYTSTYCHCHRVIFITLTYQFLMPKILHCQLIQGKNDTTECSTTSLPDMGQECLNKKMLLHPLRGTAKFWSNQIEALNLPLANIRKLACVSPCLQPARGVLRWNTAPHASNLIQMTEELTPWLLIHIEYGIHWKPFLNPKGTPKHP